ncbi:MAG: hypothetical protein V8T86_00390 [Victivallis sp.]
MPGFFADLFQDRHDPADAVALFDDMEFSPRRSEAADVRRRLRNFIEVFDIDLQARFIRNRQRVQHGVRRASHGHIEHEGVAERLRGDEILRPGRILHLRKLDDPARGAPPVLDALRRIGGDGAVAGQRDAERFAEAVHAVRREHPGTGARAGAGRAFELMELRIVDLVDHPRRNAFEDRVQIGIVRDAFGLSGAHRAAGSEDGRDIQPHRPHQHAGDDLVAVRNADHRVERMSGAHGLDAVGDDLAARKRIFHAGVAHRNAVADRDRIELVRNAARLADRVADDFADLFQVAVARNDVRVRVAHSDVRLLEILVGKPGCTHEAAMRRALQPLLHDIAAHSCSPDVPRKAAPSGHGPRLFRADCPKASGAFPGPSSEETVLVSGKGIVNVSMA